MLHITAIPTKSVQYSSVDQIDPALIGIIESIAKSSKVHYEWRLIQNLLKLMTYQVSMITDNG